MDYQSLDQGGKIMAEYVWLGGNLWDIRSKCRTLDVSSIKAGTEDIKKLPEWNYDGSSTEQAPGHNSEVMLRPCRVYRDPFRKGNNVIVICDTYDNKGNPLPTNHRAKCAKTMEKYKAHEPWFGLEQEYTMLHSDVKWPLGFPKNGYAGPQGPYYCGVGTGNAIGRELVEAHYRCCLYAGVKISGINAEVMPSQWEFQVGPCQGIQMGDDLWMARYLMMRCSEFYNIRCSFAPKPIEEGDWNGAGCHSNFSTKGTREEGGMAVIEKMMAKLEKNHALHIKSYGEDNEKRLTGKHETASIEKFSYGVADRGSSVRIPTSTKADGKGYFEDRRPAANCCPYIVTDLLVETCCSE
mmetsp:Transcript_3561/g.5509  ORF Transcript_3561/g.5509 Transcript_3561/m.5509 type:complete len:352 (+) Transcript_3561:103-1158(+)|eukprot:jgi/Bigna1/92558/estExt_fgenesh1_pm.C_320001